MGKPRVTISGSYHKHLDRILAAREKFLELGVEVLRPRTDEVAAVNEDVVLLAGDAPEVAAVQDAQLGAIEESDLLYVVNPGGYVGPSATFEVGFARRQKTPVVTSEVAFEAIVASSSRTGTPEEALAFLQE